MVEHQNFKAFRFTAPPPITALKRRISLISLFSKIYYWKEVGDKYNAVKMIQEYLIVENRKLYKILRFYNCSFRSWRLQDLLSTSLQKWKNLWISSSCKSYLYKNLNKKINHIPQNHEITQKDRLFFNIVGMQVRFEKYYIEFFYTYFCLIITLNFKSIIISWNKTIEIRRFWLKTNYSNSKPMHLANCEHKQY